MTTPSNTASGRPVLSTRHTHHHGCGPPTDPISSFSYEGYLFVPSERRSREDRWKSAQRKELPFSQADLFNEVIKQQRSGRTALEAFCDPRVVDDAKHAMIDNLIKERTTTESGSTYTLAAIKINKAYVSDEEPEYDEISLRGHESKNKEVKKRREETISVSIILQGSVIHYSDHVPGVFSQSCNPNSANAIESLSPAAEKLVSWNTPCMPTSSTPRRYLPLSYHNIDQNANWSDQSLTPQQVYQRSDDTRTRSERSSSVTSFDTTSSSSPLTPTSATSNNDCFAAVDHAKIHNSPPVLPRPLAHALLGLSISTEPTITKVLDENAQKQQPLAKQHSPTEAPERRPFTVMSSSTQTVISLADPYEDGRKETLDIPKWSTEEIRQPSTADHGPKSGSMSNLAISENCTMPTATLTDDGDSPIHPKVPRASSPDILERKPSWMDNMVPVIPPSVEMEPTETGLEEPQAESSKTGEDDSKRSNKKDTNHQNAKNCYQSEHPENGPRHSMRDESLAALPTPARQDIQASPFDAEAKARSPLKPQDTGKTKYTDSPSEKSAKGPVNEARYLPPQALGRLRSYEKPRPTDHIVGKPHQPIDRLKRYEDVKYGATDPERSPVSTSYPVPPLGKPRSYERIRPEYLRTTSASQPTGIRKIYKIKTYDEPEKAPNKHVKFSQPLASSTTLDVPTETEPSRPDTSPSSPGTAVARDPTVISCTIDDIMKPLLPRQSNYTPVYSSDTRGSQHGCSDTPPSSPKTTVARDPTESPRTTCRATSRPPLPRQSDYIPVHSSDNRGPYHCSLKDNGSKKSTQSTSREVESSDGKDGKEKEGWACNRTSCHRHFQHPFATREEAKKHIRKAHKKDRTGKYLLL